MKKLFSIIILNFLIAACVKDQTSSTTQPPVVTYPYDSIHKSLKGVWIGREFTPITNTLDTYAHLIINYDSMIYKLIPNRFNDDSTSFTIVKNYKFINQDSIECKFALDHRSSAIYDMKLLIIRYSPDSIKIPKLIWNPQQVQPFWFDGTFIK